MEFLTLKIANEYRKRAAILPNDSMQDIGERRNLREELQNRCGITELEAVNIINGYHVGTYIAKYERRMEELAREHKDDAGVEETVRGN